MTDVNQATPDKTRSRKSFSPGTIAIARLAVDLSDRLGEPIDERLREVASGHAVPGEHDEHDVPVAETHARPSDEQSHEPS